MIPPLVLLHGFLGGPWSYEKVLSELGRHSRQIAVPALSYHSPDPEGSEETLDFDGEVERLAAKARGLNSGPVDLVGYSLGGRLALALGVAYPTLVRHLILLSARRGLDTLPERERRRAEDDRWASLLETEGIETFLDTWWQQPIFRSLSHTSGNVLDAERRRRCQHDPAALARSLRRFGLANQPSFAAESRRLQVPTTVVVGGLDKKFLALAEELSARVPNGRLVVVEGVGHQLLIEAPAQVARIINEETAR